MLGRYVYSVLGLSPGSDEESAKSRSAAQQVKDTVKSLKSKKDFASKNSGGTILKADSGIKNASSILSKSNDDYLLVSNCNRS